MSYLIKPTNYQPLLDMKQTELGIKQIKEFFQQNLSSELRLRRVTAPLFVMTDWFAFLPKASSGSKIMRSYLTR